MKKKQIPRADTALGMTHAAFFERVAGEVMFRLM